MTIRDYRTLPDEALLPLDEIAAPAGPAPYRRSRFLDAVRLGEAPQPVMRRPGCTRWRWGDIRRWLDELASAADRHRADAARARTLAEEEADAARVQERAHKQTVADVGGA